MASYLQLLEVLAPVHSTIATALDSKVSSWSLDCLIEHCSLIPEASDPKTISCLWNYPSTSAIAL